MSGLRTPILNVELPPKFCLLKGGLAPTGQRDLRSDADQRTADGSTEGARGTSGAETQNAVEVQGTGRDGSSLNPTDSAIAHETRQPVPCQLGH